MPRIPTKNKTFGTIRKMQVYTPPGYPNEKKYHVSYLSCGKKDGLIRISQGMHRFLKEHEIPHLWSVDEYAHDATHWRNNLYHFVQKIFR